MREKEKESEVRKKIKHFIPNLFSNRPGSVAECEARGLLVEHRLRLRRINPQEALRELHKLYLLYSRLHGEQSSKTLAMHNLTVQVCLHMFSVNAKLMFFSLPLQIFIAFDLHFQPEKTKMILIE